jgi:hypothetical protein
MQLTKNLGVVDLLIVTKPTEKWVGELDPGSEIRNPEKTNTGSGSRRQKSTGSRIWIHNSGSKH